MLARGEDLERQKAPVSSMNQELSPASCFRKAFLYGSGFANQVGCL